MNSFEYLEKKVDVQTFNGLVTLSVLPYFDYSLGKEMLASNFVGCNGKSNEVMAKIVDMPFIDWGYDNLYQYNEESSSYFRRIAIERGWQREISQLVIDYLERASSSNSQNTQSIIVNYEAIQKELFKAWHTLLLEFKQGIHALLALLEKADRKDKADIAVAAEIIVEEVGKYRHEWQQENLIFNAITLEAKGNIESAKSIYKSIIRLNVKTQASAIANHYLAMIYKDDGTGDSLRQAIALEEKAVEINNSIGEFYHAQLLKITLASMIRKTGDYDGAMSLLEAVSNDISGLNMPEVEVSVLNTIGAIYKDKEEYETSLEMLRNAEGICIQYSLDEALIYVLTTMHSVLVGLENSEEVESVIKSKVDLFRRLNKKKMLCQTLIEYGRYLSKTAQDLKTSRNIIKEAQELSCSIGDIISYLSAMKIVVTSINKSDRYDIEELVDSQVKLIEIAKHNDSQAGRKYAAYLLLVSLSKYYDVMKAKEMIYDSNEAIISVIEEDGLQNIYQLRRAFNFYYSKSMVRYASIILHKMESFLSSSELHILYRRVAIKYFNREQYDRAIEFYDKAIKYARLSGDYAKENQCLIGKAKTLFSAEMYDQIFDCLKNVLEYCLENDDYRTYSNANSILGWSFARQQQFDKAIECYKKAIEFKPSAIMEGKSWESIGDIHLKQGNSKEALVAYQSALRVYERGNLEPSIHKINSKITNLQ